MFRGNPSRATRNIARPICSVVVTCVGKETAEQRHHRRHRDVHGVVEARPRLDAVERANQSRAEDVGAKRKLEERVLRPAADARPHRARFARRRPRRRDEHEGHRRIDARECRRHRQREIVRDARVLLFRHSDGRHAQTEEARVESLKLGLDPGQVVQVGPDEIAELGGGSCRPVGVRPMVST